MPGNLDICCGLASRDLKPSSTSLQLELATERFNCLTHTLFVRQKLLLDLISPGPAVHPAPSVSFCHGCHCTSALAVFIVWTFALGNVCRVCSGVAIASVWSCGYVNDVDMLVPITLSPWSSTECRLFLCWLRFNTGAAIRPVRGAHANAIASIGCSCDDVNAAVACCSLSVCASALRSKSSTIALFKLLRIRP